MPLHRCRQIAALRGSRNTLQRALLAGCILAVPHSGFLARIDTAAANPALSTNQQMIENLSARPGFDIDDIGSVLAYVMSELPSEVKVYPTENYYYFRFHHGGIDYAGNIRLAASDRDDGVVHFAYFPAANAGAREGRMHYQPLTEADGVKVEKLGPLVYSLSYRDRAIRFLLNDLSDVHPPASLVNDNEIYLGPVFDESAIQFFLIYNRDLKLFHYVLNETEAVPEEFRPASFTDRILIGRRTGFAFYRDSRKDDRKILVGVLAANVAVNNYYDGPFDQLPDNFNNDDRLKNAIEESDPSVAGRLDRFGYFDTGEGRYLIGPYMQYSQEQQLASFHLCATNPDVAPMLYYGCFAIQGGGQ